MRRISLLIAAVLVAQTTAMAQSPDRAAAQDAAQAPGCVAVAADEGAAAAMAAACRTRVEIESARDEYTQVFAEPQGHRTAEFAVTPQRARGLDGHWGPIDTTLQRAGDTLAPRAAAAHVRFSTGGSGPFVTLTHEGHTFSLSWPQPLPEPVVAGDSAIYPEVLPDVDLAVRATETGFSHYLIVKSSRAAKNPLVRQAKYRVGGDAELTSTVEGGLVARAKDVVVAIAGEALMWDKEKKKTARVAALAGKGEMVVTPDHAMLDDAQARFPLVVDPRFDKGQNRWAYATSDNTAGSIKDETIGPGDPSPGATIVPVGYEPDYQGRRYRGFLQFPISTIAGTQVISAKIDGKADHTWKCSEDRPSYLYRSNSISSSPRQNWPGPTLTKRIASIGVHANEGSCREANDPFEASSTTFTDDIQVGITNGWSTYTVGVSAADTTGGANESSTERWMYFFLSDYRLRIEYNTKPNRPDALTVDGKPCADKPSVKTTTPALRAHVTDDDNDSLDVSFWWSKWNGTAYVDEPGAGATQYNVPNNGTALMNVTANVDGGRYAFRARSRDDRLNSDVTADCEWTVDLTAPDAPTVTSDVYKEGEAGGSYGLAGRFTFSSSPDTQSFRWGTSDPPTSLATPATLGGSVTVDWTPYTTGPTTFYVMAIDRAGNETTRLYQFSVKAAAPAVARWRMNDPAGTATLADDTGNGRTASVLNGASAGATGLIVPGPDGISRSTVSFDGVDDRVHSDGRVIADTGRNFAVMAWVKVDDLSADRTVMSVKGTHNNVFELIASATGVWRVVSTTGDTTPATFNPPVDSKSPPRAGVWTHVGMSYEVDGHVTRLYVNGSLETYGFNGTLWNGDGVLRLGEGMRGSLADVNVWDRLVTLSEVLALGDPMRVGNVGIWRMEEVGPGPAYDGSGMLHDLTFFGGAQIPPSGAGYSGTGLRLDGVDDYAAHGGQLLRTDQSFTVSAWARMTSTDRTQTILAQENDGTDPGFSLDFTADGGGQWRFQLGPNVFVVAAAATPASYHHLVAVFDAQKRELRLYVDGGLQATTALAAAFQPGTANGRLLIGRSHVGANAARFANADIDEVRVYQGVVRSVTQIP